MGRNGETGKGVGAGEVPFGENRNDFWTIGNPVFGAGIVRLGGVDQG